MLRIRETSKKTIVTLLVFIIPVIISGCTTQSSLKAIEDYALRCRNLSDNELIIEFYQVDIQLREAQNVLWRYEIGYDRAQRQGGEAALGYAFGTLIAGHPAKRVKDLRKKKAIVLMIIYERGLRLPTSVE